MDSEVTEIITELVQANTDSSKGFEVGAENVTDLECLDLFRQLSERRTAQAIQLQELLAVDGEFPEPTGTTVAGAHRWWIAVQGTISNRNEATVLPEVAKQEEYLRQMYEDAVDAVAGTPAAGVLREHFASVTRSSQTIEELKRRFERSNA